MATLETDQTYYDAAPLGFSGWEHTQADKWENGNTTMMVRRCGQLTPHLLIVAKGGRMFDELTRFVTELDRRCALPADFPVAA